MGVFVLLMQLSLVFSAPLVYNGKHCSDCNCAEENANSSCDYYDGDRSVYSSGICSGRSDCRDWNEVGCKAEFDPEGSDRPVGSSCEISPRIANSADGSYRCMYLDENYFPSNTTIRCHSNKLYSCHDKEEGYECEKAVTNIKPHTGNECAYYDRNRTKGMYCATPKQLACGGQPDGQTCNYKYMPLYIPYDSIYYWPSTCEDGICVDADRGVCMNEDEGMPCSFNDVEEKKVCVLWLYKKCIQVEYSIWDVVKSGTCTGAQASTRTCSGVETIASQLLEEKTAASASSSFKSISRSMFLLIGFVTGIGFL